ncbi:MAG: hypothetical protein ACKVZH_06755 [Blastocatellia bacterium]
MGRPKKVATEESTVETVAKKPAVKMVEAKHVVTYSEPLTIPVTESEPEETEETELEGAEFDEGEIERRARPLSPRARLREKLAKLGVTNQALKLRIDRLPQYEINGQSGINAEKDYIRTTACTEAFFDSDDYLEHLRSFGPGTYWLTLRGGKSIVAQWQERIGGAPQAQPSAENPGIEVYQPAAPVDPMASLLKQAKQFSELRKLLAPESETLSRAAAKSEPQTTEQALLTLMNADSGLVDTVAGKLRGLLKGSGNNPGEAEKGWLDVLYMAIERDTLPKLINQFAVQFRPQQQAQATVSQPPDNTPPPMPPDVAAYQRLLTALTANMRANGDVSTVLTALDGFAALFPEHAANIEGFLSNDTQHLLGMLPQFYPPAAEVVGLPHAVEWVGKLKAAYFGEETPANE